MTRRALSFSETIQDRSLISFLSPVDSYGMDLPDYVQPLLSAAQCLSNMGVFENDAATLEAAKGVIAWTREFLDEAEEAIRRESGSLEIENGRPRMRGGR